MSLINQMLRDLDARRGPASRVETDALQGMGLAASHPADRRSLVQRIGWGLGLILTLIFVQQIYRVWSDRHIDRASIVLAGDKSAPGHRQVPVEVPSSTLPVKTLQPAPVRKLRLSDKASHPSKTSSRHKPGSTASQKPDPGLRRDDVSEGQYHASNVRPEKPPRVIKKTLTPAQSAQRRFKRAQNLIGRGQFRDASRDLRAALELNPEFDDARLQLAALYLRKGRKERAQRLLEDGYRIHPEAHRIALAYIHLLAEQGQYQQALELLQPKLRPRSTSATDLALAAGLNYRLQKFTIAATLYRKALARQPDQPVWWMGLGTSLEHSRQTTGALEAYRQANTPALDPALKHFVTGRITALTGHTD